MISFDEARNIVVEAARGIHIKQETVNYVCAQNRICAAEVLSPLAIQPFDNSAMDGFAVRRQDLEKASLENSVVLKKASIIAAGDAVPTQKLEWGCCAHIMTGAPIPPEADAVVPIELVSFDGENEVVFSAYPDDHANIRFAGEDFKKDEVILEKGDRIKPEMILPLATLGIHEISVFKKPRVAVLTTGKELVDDLSQPLSSGQIYNSNGPYAVSVLENMGTEVVHRNTIKDELDAFETEMQQILNKDVDIVISCGAVSAGAFDFVREGLEKMGAEILYHKIKLKPGKPNLLAKLPNGKLYFGLPGNPVASAVGLRFLVGAAIRVMKGQEIENPTYAKALNHFTKKAGLQMFLKGEVNHDQLGQQHVRFMDKQASFMVSPFIGMNSWILMPEEVTEVREGEMVELYSSTSFT